MFIPKEMLAVFAGLFVWFAWTYSSAIEREEFLETLHTLWLFASSPVLIVGVFAVTVIGATLLSPILLPAMLVRDAVRWVKRRGVAQAVR